MSAKRSKPTNLTEKQQSLFKGKSFSRWRNRFDQSFDNAFCADAFRAMSDPVTGLMSGHWQSFCLDRAFFFYDQKKPPEEAGRLAAAEASEKLGFSLPPPPKKKPVAKRSPKPAREKNLFPEVDMFGN